MEGRIDRMVEMTLWSGTTYDLVEYYFYKFATGKNLNKIMMVRKMKPDEYVYAKGLTPINKIKYEDAVKIWYNDVPLWKRIWWKLMPPTVKVDKDTYELYEQTIKKLKEMENR